MAQSDGHLPRQSHLLAGAYVSLGPSQDSPQFPPAIRKASQNIRFARLMGDAAYDAEHNHRLCREELGIRSTVIPLNRRRGRKWPKTRYRRQMKIRFFKRIYGQRWQVEIDQPHYTRKTNPLQRRREFPYNLRPGVAGAG
jgi:hypothetical protein